MNRIRVYQECVNCEGTHLHTDEDNEIAECVYCGAMNKVTEEEIKQRRFDNMRALNKSLADSMLEGFKNMSTEEIKRFNDLCNGSDK